MVTEILRYGLKLSRLTEDKIEMIRQWRNSPEIQQYMIYRDHITSEMQKAWFARINNEHNYYFLLSLDGREIGVMNLKDIDYQAKTAEKGSLIWDISLRGKGIGTKANVMILDFAFNDLELNSVRIEILPENIRSIKANIKFGFIHCAEISSKLYILTKENYYKHRQEIVNMFSSDVIFAK